MITIDKNNEMLHDWHRHETVYNDRNDTCRIFQMPESLNVILPPREMFTFDLSPSPTGVLPEAF